MIFDKHMCLSAMEARKLTRFDARRFARAAYEMGVRYIGGCCGFESYHIAAMSDEVRKIG
jgi:methionine synthase I (cobalamin-dependent)